MSVEIPKNKGLDFEESRLTMPNRKVFSHTCSMGCPRKKNTPNYVCLLEKFHIMFVRSVGLKKKKKNPQKKSPPFEKVKVLPDTERVCVCAYKSPPKTKKKNTRSPISSSKETNVLTG